MLYTYTMEYYTTAASIVNLKVKSLFIVRDKQVFIWNQWEIAI